MRGDRVMAHRVLAVIPARLGSKRFSNKVIYPLFGKPLLFYVHNEVRRTKSIDRIVIATDSDKIAIVAEGFGAEVVRTSRKHRTGSDRVAEVAGKIGADIVLNIQADNFGLKSSVLDAFVRRMSKDRHIKYATLARRIDSDNELFSPNLVKVVTDADDNALWFSRYPLPYLQGAGSGKRYSRFGYLGHIGIYGFRKKALEKFASWRQSPLEKAESLEQLRILENGEKMKVFRTKMDSVEVNSPSDLKKLKRIYK